MEQIKLLSQTGIAVGDKHYKLEFIFCSDWKFLAILLGLKSANSKWFCPWCLCSKAYRQLLELEWDEFLRKWNYSNRCLDCTLEDVICDDPAHGYNPLCPSLLTEPFSPESCLLDNLHGNLRTSEVLERIVFSLVDQYSLSNKLEAMCKEGGEKLF
jgi:hypothetical protein